MKYPRKIMIGFQEGVCPLKCPKCLVFSEQQNRKKEVGKMPMDKAKRLLDEIAEMEVKPFIAPGIYTEPFANPDLKEIIAYCENKGIVLSIITNGILINDEWIDFLSHHLDRRSSVSFSLDAVSQEVYEKVRGHYSLADIEKNILKLIEKRNGKGPRITVNYTTEENNYNERDLFLNKWKCIADGVRIQSMIDFDKKISNVNNSPKHKDLMCFYLNDMVIDSNGDVRICCVDAWGDTYLGNVFDDGILGVWNSDKRKMYIDKMVNGQLLEGDFCFGCESGLLNGMRRYEDNGYIINEAENFIFYNKKSEWDLFNDRKGTE